MKEMHKAIYFTVSVILGEVGLWVVPVQEYYLVLSEGQTWKNKTGFYC